MIEVWNMLLVFWVIVSSTVVILISLPLIILFALPFFSSLFGIDSLSQMQASLPLHREFA